MQSEQPEQPEGEDVPPWTGGPSEPAWPAVPQRSRRRPGLTVVVLILALCGLAGSVVGMVNQFLPRSFTAAQQRQIMAWEMARRWRTTPAGKMFPATVSYQLPGIALNSSNGLRLTAQRVGIARQAGCAAATDRTAGQILDRLGCTAVLRATYGDPTDSMVVTVGVAVLPDKAAAAAAAGDLSAAGTGPASGGNAGGGPASGQLRPGIRPAAFSGTLAAGFGDAQRQLSFDTSDGPYLILAAAGFADRRPRVLISSDAYADQEMGSFADGVASVVGAPLGVLPAVPRCPGAPGC
jgi:hypothetical protein